MAERRVPNTATSSFYRENHTKQTYLFVLRKKIKYSFLSHGRASILEMMDRLDSIIDNSDPDINIPQSHHAYQTAEALRKDGHPDWLVLTGLIHDLGKVLLLWGEPQWAVVGDTYPVGCAFENTIIHSPYFTDNPDFKNSRYSTKNGIYTPGCGFNNVHFSLSHDWYLYHVLRNQSKLPKEALYIIRHHSFYAHHTNGGYTHLMNDYDRDMMKWVKLFQRYDLYSKEDKPVNITEIKPYYVSLIEKYIPGILNW